jgi:hypothetical protein
MTTPIAERLASATELAGFFLAHAVWSVSEGETLVPILALERDRKRSFHRIENERYEDAVTQGKEWLAENPEDAERAVLVFDGYFTLDSHRKDALVAEIVDYGQTPEKLRIILPYRHANAKDGFAVYRPKIDRDDLNDADLRLIAEALWRGVDSHAQGSAVWSKYLDQTF